jgi:crotonobetainyl-CoA:carnitine CoA-transferase CaiB-like acyl-CoA transferase
MAGPLHGTRGIVLTQAWAGSWCTSLLGMLGADVVQVEVRKRPDSWRGDYAAPLPALLREVETAVNPWNCNGLYNSVNLGKRCITLDLGDARGMDIFKRLLVHADFCAENFSPRVLGNFGITYEQMCEIKPDIVLASLSAYGHSGPWENIPGIGGTIEPSSGMSGLLGYEDDAPQNSGQMFPDAIAALNGCGAIITALRHRDRTGRGQYIDLSMQESSLGAVGDAYMEYAMTGRQWPRMGNHHPTFAPHSIYPATGEERWVALACEDDGQWAALAAEAGEGWADDPRFRTMADRKANEAALDALIEAWTAPQDRDALVARLLAAGVIAAPVVDSMELADDPVLRGRNVIREIEHPEVGRWPQVTLPMVFTRTVPDAPRHAPLQGQHNHEVLAELLDMSADEVDELIRVGVSGMGPPD